MGAKVGIPIPPPIIIIMPDGPCATRCAGAVRVRMVGAAYAAPVTMALIISLRVFEFMAHHRVFGAGVARS